MTQTVVLICERECGHPSEEVEQEHMLPQTIMQCPNCNGPRIAKEPDETFEEYAARILSGYVEVHTETDVEYVPAHELGRLISMIPGGDHE
jgi:hypothetical protein